MQVTLLRLSTGKIMNCPQCQSELYETQTFCHNCGEEVVAARPKPKSARTDDTPPLIRPGFFYIDKEGWAAIAVVLPVIALAAYLYFSPSEPTEKEKNDRYIAYHQAKIMERLKDPDSAKFSGLFVSKSSGSPVVCGLVDGKNSFGGYNGYQRFISAGTLQVLSNDMAFGEMDTLWAKLCDVEYKP
jgi:hypothetical protein